MGKLNKTDREWQRELSPDEFRITRHAVVRHYLILKINMTVVAAGQVFISHSIRL